MYSLPSYESFHHDQLENEQDTSPKRLTPPPPYLDEKPIEFGNDKKIELVIVPSTPVGPRPKELSGERPTASEPEDLEDMEYDALDDITLEALQQLKTGTRERHVHVNRYSKVHCASRSGAARERERNRRPRDVDEDPEEEPSQHSGGDGGPGDDGDRNGNDRDEDATRTIRTSALNTTPAAVLPRDDSHVSPLTVESVMETIPSIKAELSLLFDDGAHDFSIYCKRQKHFRASEKRYLIGVSEAFSAEWIRFEDSMSKILNGVFTWSDEQHRWDSTIDLNAGVESLSGVPDVVEKKFLRLMTALQQELQVLEKDLIKHESNRIMSIVFKPKSRIFNVYNIMVLSARFCYQVECVMKQEWLVDGRENALKSKSKEDWKVRSIKRSDPMEGTKRHSDGEGIREVTHFEVSEILGDMPERKKILEQWG